MLRKRARVVQKDQQMGQVVPEGVLVQKQKTSSFFNVSGLLVGMTPMVAIDCDSVRSPTSPLDFKLFSNLGSSLRIPISSHDSQQKCWDTSNKVGLSIVDTLGGDDEDCDGKVISSSSSKNILFGPQIRTKSPTSPTHLKFCDSPKSLPNNYQIPPPTQIMGSNLQKGKSDVLFEIGEGPLEPDPFKIQSFSLDSKQIGSYKHHLTDPKANFEARSSGLAKGTAQVSSGSDKVLHCGASSIAIPSESSNRLIGSLSASEIELSEDYTCVITHGPNPKTTHIFCDCILESHSGCKTDCGNNRASLVSGIPVAEKCLDVPNPYPLNDFLSFCFYCKKNLEEGKDIYMYRGEKAFCSLDCRFEVIRIEEAKEKPVSEAPPKESHQSETGDQIFEMFVPL